MTTQPEDLSQSPTPEEVAGMEWWNSLGEIARSYWLARANCGTVADAYAAFKHDQTSRSTESK
ncbi:TPA: hypothetical protein ACK11K_005241 [Pseudomonas aeruginosa]